MLTLFYTILVIEPTDLSTLDKHSTKIAAAVAPSDVLLRHSLHSSKHVLLDL